MFAGPSAASTPRTTCSEKPAAKEYGALPWVAPSCAPRHQFGHLSGCSLVIAPEAVVIGVPLILSRPFYGTDVIAEATD
jgi:hypothetical protein